MDYVWAFLRTLAYFTAIIVGSIAFILGVSFALPFIYENANAFLAFVGLLAFLALVVYEFKDQLKKVRYKRIKKELDAAE